MSALKKMKRRFLRLRFVIAINLFFQSITDSDGTRQVDKINKIISAQRFFQLPTFVETGTYMATTLISVRKHFETSYSIELNHEFAQEAQHHFRNQKNVTIIEGDSGDCLEQILSTNTTKKLFWLDAHYSGGMTAQSTDFGHTPISKELEVIMLAWVKGSVILIDDARFFIGKDNYPTMADLTDYIQNQTELSLFVDADIIHIY
jgi:hypothetical protein